MEFKRKLCPRGNYEPKFDPRQLIYPDAASRSKLYAAAKEWGFMNTNDIRELEGMNPVDGKVGDGYWMPTTSTWADEPRPQPAPAGKPKPEPDEDEQSGMPDEDQDQGAQGAH